MVEQMEHGTVDSKDKGHSLEMDAEILSLVSQGTLTIKNHMPHTYAAIQHEAAHKGKSIWALVRRGLAGEPDCFWAREGAYIVGTRRSGVAADDGFSLCIFGADVARPPNGLFSVNAAWRAADRAYQQHHGGCRQCVSAGHGRGERCEIGAGLWVEYEQSGGW